MATRRQQTLVHHAGAGHHHISANHPVEMAEHALLQMCAAAFLRTLANTVKEVG